MRKDSQSELVYLEMCGHWVDVCLSARMCLGDDVSGSVDSLDAYMSSVGDHLDKTKRSEIKHQLHELRRVSQAMLSGVLLMLLLPIPMINCFHRMRRD